MTDMETNFDSSVCLRQHKGESLYLGLQNKAVGEVCYSTKPNYADTDGLLETRSSNKVKMTRLHYVCFVLPE